MPFAVCARATLIDPAGALRELELVASPGIELSPHYNLAPSEPLLAVTNEAPGLVVELRWGLVPWFADDPKIAHKLINARAESAAVKPSFRDSFRRRRCVILVDGFYEWTAGSKRGAPRQPHHVRRRDGRVFGLAGLFDVWRKGAGPPLRSCVILTTEPNELIAPLHDRMPAVLPLDAWPRWLAPGEVDPAALQELLVPYPAALLEERPVSLAVNKPENDGPELLLPP